MPRKTRNHQLDLPQLELDCMRAVWERGEATVHEVRAQLLPERPLAYTTVMTVMTQLAKKGMVERRRRGRPFVYRPLVTEQSVLEHALDRLTRNFFVSSRDRLRNYLGGESRDGRASQSELPPQSAPLPALDPTLL